MYIFLIKKTEKILLEKNEWERKDIDFKMKEK